MVQNSPSYVAYHFTVIQLTNKIYLNRLQYLLQQTKFIRFYKLLFNSPTWFKIPNLTLYVIKCFCDKITCLSKYM